MFNPLSNWIERHKDPTNFWLHMPGIVGCFVVAPILVYLQSYYLAAAIFVAGYAIQFIGHLTEGSPSGEEMFLRRLLGK